MQAGTNQLVAGLITMMMCLSVQSKPLNVLMIAIDDLRPELGCYGCNHMVTPHMDTLAKESLVFERAYVSIALCSPSRTALLTSRRPDTSRVWEISPAEYWRKCGGNFTTLPQYFKEKGYLSLGMGKVFHPGAPSGNDDVKYSWSPECLPYVQSLPNPPHGGGHPVMHAFDNPAEDMGERKLANLAVNYIKQLRHNRTTGVDDRPFFLAVGFHKPHVPWFAPKTFFDMYPLDKVHLAPNLDVPAYVPPIAMQSVLEGWTHKYTDLQFSLGHNYPTDNVTCPIHTAKKMRQAYYASTTFTDSNIGVVLKALRDYGFENNTVISLWGDHGYQLGDNNEWAKQDCFEHATRIPWMMKLPRHHPKFANFTPGRTSTFIEEVDLFPTLTELVLDDELPRCSLNVNTSRKTEICTEGFSFAPVLLNHTATFKDAAFSQYERKDERVMGYSIRDNRNRYNEWVAFDNKTGTPDWSKQYGRELYIHKNPVPGPCQWDYEHVNVVDFPEHAALVKRLQKRLHEGWRNGRK
eukprot:TRINITY_DN94530_c0_g1_i1.p1 TRINITY_DN94530_c0_g1~~TRINITY_DN94530_c0_g1_i1.p1  ORF type:complete len:521 (+),score=67.26 TRINITY_DN94530_c0_g1_i1:45-1607(+)